MCIEHAPHCGEWRVCVERAPPSGECNVGVESALSSGECSVCVCVCVCVCVERASHCGECVLNMPHLVVSAILL